MNARANPEALITLKLSGIDLVTFDIFDTLLHRRVAAPVDAFEMVRARICHDAGWVMWPALCRDFSKLRIEAESKARARRSQEFGGEHEVNLDEIYDCLQTMTSLSITMTDRLKAIELEVEDALLYASPWGLAAYNQAVLAGKRVGFISDMYLPPAQLEQWLRNKGFLGVGAENLFVSGTVRASKHSGRLFDHVARALNAKPKTWLHVGDNPRADIIRARQRGIRVHHADWAKIHNTHTASTWPSDGIAQSFVRAANQPHRLTPAEEESDLFSEGYRTLGPVFLGFYSWLRHQLKQQQPDKILFMARDAQLLLRMHEAGKAHNVPLSDATTEYVYVSRQSLFPLAVRDFPLWRIGTYVGGKSHRTIDQLLRTLKLDCADCAQELKESELEPHTALGHHNHEQATQLIKRLYMRLMQSSAKQRLTLGSYLRTTVSNARKHAIIDIGWNGNIQASFLRALGSDLQGKQFSGLYFGLSEGARLNTEHGHTMRGWFMDMGLPQKNQKMIWTGGAELLEFVMTANHGSTLTYEKATDESVRPVLEKKIESETAYEKASLQVQAGILQYFLDHLFLLQMLPDEAILSHEWHTPLQSLVEAPNQRQITTFSDLTHSDIAGENRSRLVLAPKLSLLVRWLNPIQAIKEYKQAYWKSGFLRRNYPFAFRSERR